LLNLRAVVSDYEGKLKVLESIKETYTYKEAQSQQEIGRLANQIRLLQA
jgi:hypothetical protein